MGNCTTPLSKDSSDLENCVEQLETTYSSYSNATDTQDRDGEAILITLLTFPALRISFIKYIESCGSSRYLDFYFEVNALKEVLTSGGDLDYIFDEATALRNRYHPSNFPRIVNDCVFRIWEYNVSVDTCSDINNLRSAYMGWKTEVAKIITNEILPNFLLSKEYLQFKRDNNLVANSAFVSSSLRGKKSNKVDPSSVEERLFDKISIDVIYELSVMFPKVLIVEKSRVLQNCISNTLKYYGHDVDFAANGSDALQKFEGAIFDIILIDNNMPKEDGFDSISALALRNCEGGRVIRLLSGRETEQTIPESGRLFFLHKPFLETELYRILQYHKHMIKSLASIGPLFMSPGGGDAGEAATTAGEVSLWGAHAELHQSVEENPSTRTFNGNSDKTWYIDYLKSRRSSG